MAQRATPAANGGFAQLLASPFAALGDVLVQMISANRGRPLGR
jgi:hypothetical protein